MRSSASEETPSTLVNDVSPVSAMVIGPLAGRSAGGMDGDAAFSDRQAARKQKLRMRKQE